MRVLQDALAAPLPEITFPASDAAYDAPEPSGKPDQETILSLAQEVLNQKDTSFGAWLKEQRKNLGMTQKTISYALGYRNSQTVGQIELGKWLPSIKCQQQIKERIEQLFKEKGFTHPPQPPSMNDAALQEMSFAPPLTPAEKEELKMPADFETRTDEPLPSAKGDLQPAGDFMVTYDRINWLVFAGLYKLNDSGMLKVKEYLQDLLHNEENLESCFADADD